MMFPEREEGDGKLASGYFFNCKSVV